LSTLLSNRPATSQDELASEDIFGADFGSARTS